MQLKKTSVWFTECGLDGVLQYFRPELEKKKFLLFPQTKITILITMVMFRCSHSAAGRTRLRWHWPLGMGTRSGPTSREITGWCGGRRERRPASTPCCQPRESYCWQLAGSSLFHLRPLEIIGDVLSVNMFLCFKVKFHCCSQRTCDIGQHGEKKHKF